MAEKRELTVEQVKKLPVGSRVELHGHDRRGEHTWLECTIAPSYRKKVLRYRDVDGLLATKPIKKYPNKWYTEGVKS